LFILTKKNKIFFCVPVKFFPRQNEVYNKKTGLLRLKVLPVKSFINFKISGACLVYIDLFARASRKNIKTEKSFLIFKQRVIHFRYRILHEVKHLNKDQFLKDVFNASIKKIPAYCTLKQLFYNIKNCRFFLTSGLLTF